jgi:hypothetical protein
MSRHILAFACTLDLFDLLDFLHLSEQYLMSCQFLDQTLRHVIVKPHSLQNLLGKLLLLPLKEILTLSDFNEVQTKVFWHINDSQLHRRVE